MTKNLSMKYWQKHKGRAASIILAVAVSMAALTSTAFLARSASVANLEEQLDYSGFYDIILPDISAENLSIYEKDECFSAHGTLYRGGVIITSNNGKFTFGALSKKAVRLYHFTPYQGRYPRKAGEVTAYRRFFEANGVSPRVGKKITLELHDFDGNLVSAKEYTIAGILEDERRPSIYRTLWGHEEYEFPQVFFCEDEMPENGRRDMLANYAVGGDDLKELKRELARNGVTYVDGNRIMMMNSVALTPINEFSEIALRDALGGAQKDFYAYALIPVFSSVVLLVAFVSIYNVVSASLSERKRQLAMLRCIGMEKGQALKMSFLEMAVMVACGTAVGFLLGIAVYLFILLVQEKIMGLRVYQAFIVDPVISATTVNPYVFPLVVCSACSFAAAFLPYIVQLSKSPVEGLRDRVTHRAAKGFRLKRKALLICRISGNFRQNLASAVIIFTVIWTAVFGFAYFSEQSKLDNYTQRLALEDAQLADMDYLAERGFERSICGNAEVNRHSLGIRADLAEEIFSYDKAEYIYGCIQAISTKLVCDENQITDGMGSFLADVDVDNMVAKGFEEGEAKARSIRGYLPNEKLFNIPTVGVPEDMFGILSKYIVEGDINTEGLISGEEVLIIKKPDTEIPFSAGDLIQMTDVVIHDAAVEEYDFYSGSVTEDFEPCFYFRHTDNKDSGEIPGYAFGSRQDFNVKVGGILEITDNETASFLYTRGIVGDCGINILCSDKAFESWKLPDRNYTKLGVKLSDKSDVAEFEELWYRVIGNSPETESVSKKRLLGQMADIERTDMSIFFAIILVVIGMGMVGIVNSSNLRVRRQLRAYSILRALGMSKEGLMAVILTQGIFLVAFGALTSFVPLRVFETVRLYAVRMFNEGQMGVITEVKNGRVRIPWQALYPTRIELFSQPIMLIAGVVFVIMCALIIISNMIPAIWIAKKNITEGIYNDDF